MESRLYKKLKESEVICQTCNHYCRIKPGKRGICGVRGNTGGHLEFLAYDKVIAANADPIEKKPIYHLKPGSRSFSIATPGCNFKCDFCQNSDIAQMPAENNGRIDGRPLTPRQIVDQAFRAGCDSISYTYTEPTVFFELAYDTACLAKKDGLLNIFVTNGFMSGRALEMLTGILDAANVDLKSFDPGFYTKFCKAGLEPVKDNLKQMVQTGMLVEITTLLIPGLNDDPGQVKAMAEFIASDLGCHTPWHISRFHPSYRMTGRGVTPVASLESAYDAGKNAGLHHVYIGNLPGHDSENTHCHSCGALVIQRRGYRTQSLLDPGGICTECGVKIHGMF